MAEPKKGLDVILALGGGKPPSGGDEGKSDAPDAASDSPDLPMDYVASFRDYQKNPSPETFWEAVKSCMESYNDNKVSSDERMKHRKQPWPGDAGNFVERQSALDKD